MTTLQLQCTTPRRDGKVWWHKHCPLYLLCLINLVDTAVPISQPLGLNGLFSFQREKRLNTEVHGQLQVKGSLGCSALLEA